MRAQTRSKTQACVAHTPGRRHSFAGALANNLVSKGLTARPKTVTRASDALLLLIELDAAEATVVSPHAARWRRCRHARRTMLSWLVSSLVPARRTRFSKACKASCRKALLLACQSCCKPSGSERALVAVQASAVGAH